MGKTNSPPVIILSTDSTLVAKLNALRAELADLAFELECHGRCDAADITNQLGARLAEFAGELGAAEAGPRITSHPSREANPRLP